ncbi:MAG TPA: hypothetical protein VEK57_17450 [Thermoanaerobaculia bacterium]|nr:hypothetical protein [Thermoanaerobaculia bacterium]
MRRLLAAVLLSSALPALAQHDITSVEPATPGSVAATPIPTRRGMKKYDIPDLDGAQQALGSQLLDGRLRRPLMDFFNSEREIRERISIFEGGLVVVQMTGPATIRKKLLLPPAALQSYLEAVTAEGLEKVDARTLAPPETDRRALLRVYRDDGGFVERSFNPTKMLPMELNDQIAPLRDLVRAISEDRSVTSSVAGYEPKAGDELVADDQKTYRVMRVVDGAGVVELKCLDAPTTIYVTKSDLHLYFVGAKPKPAP